MVRNTHAPTHNKYALQILVTPLPFIQFILF